MAEVRCPKCGSRMLLRVAKRGPISGKSFYGCSKYPYCTETLPADLPSLSPSPPVYVTPDPTELSKASRILSHDEAAISDFDGTVVDIETIGDFDDHYKHTNDSRLYRNVKQVVFGYIDNRGLHILCAQGTTGIDELTQNTRPIIDRLETPLHAFNCDFERGVWFHHLGKTVAIEKELQEKKFESKEDAVRILGISDYGDPFHGEGRSCMVAWLRGEYNSAIAHNRACLLKERDILIARGCWKPDDLKLNPD